MWKKMTRAGVWISAAAVVALGVGSAWAADFGNSVDYGRSERPEFFVHDQSAQYRHDEH